MEEGIRKREPKNQPYSSSETEQIKKRRTELISEGLDDKAIARRISREIGRKLLSVYSKIRQLVDTSALQKNPNMRNKRDFENSEITGIIKIRNELALEGLTDHEISCIVAEQIGRKAGSIGEKIRKLVNSGEVERNPNKREQKRFLEQETRVLIDQRDELILDGLTDYEIAKKIAPGFKRSSGTMDAKIRSLVNAKKVIENPNKREMRPYSSADLDHIQSKRTELSEKGFTDMDIAREISQGMNRSLGSVHHQLKKLVRDCGIPSNPNKKRRDFFSSEDVDFILARRQELVGEGLCDAGIGRIVAKELGRKHRSVAKKIQNLVAMSILKPNPNKKERKGISDEEVESIIKMRKELEGDIGDVEISRRIGKIVHRDSRCILKIIKSLEKSGKLAVNTNREKEKPKKRPTGFFKKMSDEDLVAFAIEHIRKNNCKTKSDLIKSDGSLYIILLTRGLIQKLGMENRRRDWKSLDDGELVRYTKSFMIEKQIEGRRALSLADPSLYVTLRRRNLLDAVFSGIDQSRQQEKEIERLLALSKAAEAMEQFGERR